MKNKWTAYNGIAYNPVHNPAPKPPHPTCKRKIGFRNRQRADNVLEQMMAKRPAKDVENLYVYHCPHCNKWHLGNRKGKKP